MRYRIIHKTQYTTVEPISVGHNEAWLTPRKTPTQVCLLHHMEFMPEPSIVVTRQDHFHNSTVQGDIRETLEVAKADGRVLERVGPASAVPTSALGVL